MFPISPHLPAVCTFQVTLLSSRQEWNEGCGGEGRKLGDSGLYVGIQWVGVCLTDGVTAWRDTRLYTQCFWEVCEFLFPWQLKQRRTEGCVCVCVLSWSAGVWGCSDWQQNIAQTGTNGHHGTERNISFPLEPNVSCVSTSCGVHEIKTSDVYEVLYNIGANIYFSVLISYEHFACLVHSVTSTKNRNDIKAPHWIAGNL